MVITFSDPTLHTHSWCLGPNWRDCILIDIRFHLVIFFTLIPACCSLSGFGSFSSNNHTFQLRVICGFDKHLSPQQVPDKMLITGRAKVGTLW